MFNVCKHVLCGSIRSIPNVNRFPNLLMSSPLTSGKTFGTSTFRVFSKMVRTDVREELGDLFSAPASTSLAHCVSSDMKMGAGIAVLFRKKFGRVDNLKDQGKTVGEVAYLKDGPRYIFYLVTKQWFYNKPTEETLLSSLLEMRSLCDEFGVKRLAMPRIGCGLDGLQWPVVYEMVKEVFAPCNMEVTIYSIPDRKSMNQNPMYQKSMTPNLSRTQEKFRNFFDRRPSSLPASEMTSKRKMHSLIDDDEYDTPKKRMRPSFHESTGLPYQRDKFSSQTTLRRSHNDFQNTFRSNFASETSNGDDSEAQESHELSRRDRPSGSGSWNKMSSEPAGQDQGDFMALSSPRKRGFIPFIADERTRDKIHNRETKRSPLPSQRTRDVIPFISDEPTRGNTPGRESKRSSLSSQRTRDVIPFISDEPTRGNNPSHEPKRSSLNISGCDKSSPTHKKRMYSRQGDGSSEEEEFPTGRNRPKNESKHGRSQFQESPGRKKESRDSDKNKDRKASDSNRSRERKVKNSSVSRERKSRGSSGSKERKSRDSSKSKERKSRKSSRSKESKSRDSSRSEERKSRDRSRSKERKSRDLSRSKERKSRDSSRSKDRKSRKSSKSKEKKSRDSSRSEEREYCSNKKQVNTSQHSDQSDCDSEERTSGVTNRKKERYRSYGVEESSTNSSPKKGLTNTLQGRLGDVVTEYSFSYKVKKHVQNYPSLNIIKNDKKMTKSAPTGSMYSDRPNASNSVKNRLSLNRKP